MHAARTQLHNYCRGLSLPGAGGAKSKKAVLFYKGKEKGQVAGVAVLSAIASIYGDDTF